MALSDPIELLVTTKPDPESSGDVYLNERPLSSFEGVRAAFGGSLLGQSVTAAAATVPPAFHLYSAQSAFLRPADGKESVSYQVDRIADGKTYATRIVRAIQGACVFVATLSFQRTIQPAGNVLNYAVPMPDIGGIGPEHVPDVRLQQMKAPADPSDVFLSQVDPDDEPFDWRPLEDQPRDDPTKFRHRAFVRAPPMSSKDPFIHHGVLAYLSDRYMLGTALNANSVATGDRLRNVLMGASLTHIISVHNPMAKMDEWMLCERETSWGSGGRVLIHQRLWAVGTGLLVMSGTQEGLIRLQDAQL